jgi:uncharacterized membrane protein YkvA (DUF1232 family)
MSRDVYKKLREKVDSQAASLNPKYGPQVVGWLLLLPDLFALTAKLAMDGRVPMKDKGVLGVAVLYIISPVDLVPEALVGPVGLLDDLAVLAIALNRMKEGSGNPEIMRELWAGQGDVLEHIEKICGAVDDFVERNVLVRIRKILGGA